MVAWLARSLPILKDAAKRDVYNHLLRAVFRQRARVPQPLPMRHRHHPLVKRQRFYVTRHERVALRLNRAHTYEPLLRLQNEIRRHPARVAPPLKYVKQQQLELL